MDEKYQRVPPKDDKTATASVKYMNYMYSHMYYMHAIHIAQARQN